MPPKNTSLENIVYIKGHFQVVCVMDTEKQATATLYTKQGNTRIVLCPNIAVLHPTNHI